MKMIKNTQDEKVKETETETETETKADTVAINQKLYQAKKKIDLGFIRYFYCIEFF